MDTKPSTRISQTGKDYFLQVARTKWNFREAFKKYKNALVSPVDICNLMRSDLDHLKEIRHNLDYSIAEFKKDIQFFEEETLSIRSQPQQTVNAETINDNYNQCSNITKNVTNIMQGNKRGPDAETDEDTEASSSDSTVSIKRSKKNYCFVPVEMELKPIIVGANKPRLTEEDASSTSTIFAVALSSHQVVPDILKEDYISHKRDQSILKCLKKHVSAHAYLTRCLEGLWEDFEKALSETEKNGEDMEMMHHILYDYRANCKKPSCPVSYNERTPYVEFIIPIFKYFSASTSLVSFLWCEIGLVSQKKILLCLSEGQKKLLDGIGYDQYDAERVLFECSGENDGTHTEEDTLKLIECTTQCLKAEMERYGSASWETYGKRKIFAVQCVRDTMTLMSTSRLETGKWGIVECRSAEVPRNWKTRYSWMQVFEMLFKLEELLSEQESITEKLNREQSGVQQVKFEDTIQACLKNCA